MGRYDVYINMYIFMYTYIYIYQDVHIIYIYICIHVHVYTYTANISIPVHLPAKKGKDSIIHQQKKKAWETPGFKSQQVGKHVDFMSKTCELDYQQTLLVGVTTEHWANNLQVIWFQLPKPEHRPGKVVGFIGMGGSRFADLHIVGIKTLDSLGDNQQTTRVTHI